MIHIVGGCYIEKCSDPYYSEFYGSGLRAAVALSELIRGVRLTTYVGDDQRANLEAAATTFGIDARFSPCSSTLEFSYRHPLAVPNVKPNLRAIIQAPPFSVSDEKVLRFGFLEGDSVVEADWAVYDPQSPRNPRRFDDNGSRAKHLAIVANLAEARGLSGESEISKMGKQLLTSQEADVVVVKQGPLGCKVFSRGEAKAIPVFITESIWPIGSGDVFSAMFAYSWAELGLDPFVAAERSSLASAFYCSTKCLPLPPSVENFPGFGAKPLLVEGGELRSTLVYLAGPFFTMAERYMVEETKYALESQGLSVFSPYHEVGPGPTAQVVPANINGIERSALVFALLDGLDPGTIFEIGYARKKGLPVVIFAQSVVSEDLKMFEGTNCLVIDDFASAVYRAVWTTMGK